MDHLEPGKSLNKTYCFTGQDDGEKILYVIHRHWFDILVQFIFLIAGLFLVGGSFFFFTVLYPDLLGDVRPTFFYFVESFLLLILWFFAFLVWIDYYLDVWIVTDKRIVNIDQRGLFVREMSELHLFRIQDVTSEVQGFFPSMLNYGDVYVQSAGTVERFVFEKVPDPYAVKDILMDLTRDTRQEEVEFIQSAFEGKKM